MSRPRRVAAALLTLTVCGLAGCAAPTAPSAAPGDTALPPRPATLPLNHVDPCQLLTRTQVKQFNLLDGIPDMGADGIDCDWSGQETGPDNGWVAQLVLAHGAEHYYRSGYSHLMPMDGFTAVVLDHGSTPTTDRSCQMFLDVAPGQSLRIAYFNLVGDLPGINYQVACQQAAKAAHLMLANLHNLAH